MNVRQDLVLVHLVVVVILVQNCVEELLVKRVGSRLLLPVQHMLILGRQLRLHGIVLPLQVEHVARHRIVDHRGWAQIRRHRILIVDVLLHIARHGGYLTIIVVIVPNKGRAHFLWIYQTRVRSRCSVRDRIRVLARLNVERAGDQGARAQVKHGLLLSHVQRLLHLVRIVA